MPQAVRSHAVTRNWTVQPVSFPRLVGKVRVVVMASDLANPRLAGKGPNHEGRWFATPVMNMLMAARGAMPGEFDVEYVAPGGSR